MAGPQPAGFDERIRVERTGEILVDCLEVATTSWQRFFGLMGRSWMPRAGGLWLEPCNSIHMSFMRFSIDVVWLDSQNVVLKVSSRVRPWLGFACHWPARVALEIPAGNAKALRVGDRLERVS